MSTASNRAHAKLASKRRYRPTARRGVPSTAPYETAVALTGDDIGDLQTAIDSAPGPDALHVLDNAASTVEKPVAVTLKGQCPHCGKGVTLRKTIEIPGMAVVASRLRALRDKLAEFDPAVLQRMIDHMGRGASLWWTKGG